VTGVALLDFGSSGAPGAIGLRVLFFDEGGDFCFGGLGEVHLNLVNSAFYLGDLLIDYLLTMTTTFRVSFTRSRLVFLPRGEQFFRG